MPKYYLSKSNSATDQSTAQSPNTDYAILLSDSNPKLVRFFQKGNHKGNLEYSGYSQPTKSLFSSKLGDSFNKFFSGDSANSSINAFSYMRSNGGWPA